jgi:adenosylmethionine-8-amino-7-oxononanoate aminotransferase
MPSDKELLHWDHEHLWHPFTKQSEWLRDVPLLIDHARGCELFDRAGNAYIDGISSLWCNVHGHGHPTLDDAVRGQLERMAHSTLLGLSHEPAIVLARRLVECAPRGLSRVFLSDNGATAVEVAIKIAFQYWRQKPNPEPRRTRFVALEGAYHGDTLGDVSVGGVARFHAMFAPLLFPVSRVPAPHCYRCPLGLARPECGIACLSEAERILRTHPGEVAAIVVEPIVQGAAGMITHPRGYLDGLRRLADAYDTLLIADEVAVGFGRTGRLFACEHEDVAPDFLCLAKGITGGYLPLAATLTTERVYAAFNQADDVQDTFFHGHTYGGNPLAAAVAIANLDIFEQEQTLLKLGPKIELLRAWLTELRESPCVGDVRQAGLIAGIEVVADRASKLPFPPSDRVGQRVCARARALGVIIRPLGDVVVVMPPLAISMELLGRLLDIVAQCLREVTPP